MEPHALVAALCLWLAVRLLLQRPEAMRLEAIESDALYSLQ
jgi:hypothetical protein